MKKSTFSFLTALSSEQKSKLKGLAHHLKPVVQIGHQGFTETVKSEISLALEKHELIKIQLPADTNSSSKEEKQSELLGLLPKNTHLVSRIGRTIILYLQKKPEEQKIKL